MKLENGEWTTIHKDEVDKFRAKGYEIGPKAKSPAKWDIEHALMFEKYGKAYQDEGEHRGDIAIKQKSGKTGYAKQKNVQSHLDQGDKLGNIKDIK